MSNCTSNAENEKISSRSELDKKTCSYIWTIDNFQFSPVGNVFDSPAFTGVGDDFEWRLMLIREKNCKVFIYLYPYSCYKDDIEKYHPVAGNLKITLMNSDGNWYRSGDFRKASFRLDLRDGETDFKLYICEENEIPGVSCSNKLFVWCYIEYYLKRTSSFDSILSRDLERIRIDEDFSDTTISINGKSYPVHKVILAARSSVFKAMFRNDMQESQKNHITITDIEQETFEEMLHYIYTGEMRNLDEWAFELLPAADKYDLKELKKGCEGILITKLSTDNVAKILVLADMHNFEELKANSLRFIKANYVNCEDFENTEMWKILTESRPSLMKDMLALFFRNE